MNFTVKDLKKVSPTLPVRHLPYEMVRISLGLNNSDFDRMPARELKPFLADYANVSVPRYVRVSRPSARRFQVWFCDCDCICDGEECTYLFLRVCGSTDCLCIGDESRHLADFREATVRDLRDSESIYHLCEAVVGQSLDDWSISDFGSLRCAVDFCEELDLPLDSERKTPSDSSSTSVTTVSSHMET